MNKHKKHHDTVLNRLLRKKSARKIYSPKKWLLVLFVVLFLIIDSILIFEFIYANKFYPGILINNVPVGGKTYGDIMYHYNTEAAVLKDAGLRINFSDGGGTKEIHIPLSAQGLTPDKSFEYFSLGDWEKPIQAAYQFGRTGSFDRRVREQLSLLSNKKFDLQSTLYEVSVRSFLSRELELFLKKTEPAHFAVNARGEIYIVPEKIGESVDMEEIISVLKKKIASFDSASENFKTKREVPLSTEEKLKPFTKFAVELYQNNTLIFRSETRKWKVSGRTLATWLSINRTGGIGIDEEKLTSFLSQTIASEINDPSQNSRFEMRNGKLKEIIPGRSGSVVDMEKVKEEVGKIIPDMQKSFVLTGDFTSLLTAANTKTNFDPKTGAFNIAIEITKEEPEINQATVDQYGINDLVGFSKTSFKGSSVDRIKNITTGAAKLNGLLIAPAEEFSAVNAIGYVTAEAGYVKEYVIKDNKSVKEFGGGLCQIATTLFRLALNAGLPITERANHRYVVSYYGPGLDATIYGPHPDFRFVNDTGHYLLLQARVSGTDLVLELYGQKDGRQVSISEPVLSEHIPAPETKYIPSYDMPFNTEKCSETPRAGVTADVTYRVAFLNGEVREQHFHSVYEPWQKICLIGTKK
jgi:vancomycin resistance protein YoaR